MNLIGLVLLTGGLVVGFIGTYFTNSVQSHWAKLALCGFTSAGVGALILAIIYL